MERRKPLNLKAFNWKRIGIETAALLLVTVIIAWAISTQIHMTAPAAQGQAAFYADVGLTQPITSPWDWAPYINPLTNGATIGVWLHNTGSTDLNVTIQIFNPTCIITADPTTFQLPVGAIQGITLTFSGIVGGSTIEWDLKADY
jgi:hypothetical protein